MGSVGAEEDRSAGPDEIRLALCPIILARSYRRRFGFGLRNLPHAHITSWSPSNPTLLSEKQISHGRRSSRDGLVVVDGARAEDCERDARQLIGDRDRCQLESC